MKHKELYIFIYTSFISPVLALTINLSTEKYHRLSSNQGEKYDH
jgi:hypothetical protein